MLTPLLATGWHMRARVPALRQRVGMGGSDLHAHTVARHGKFNGYDDVRGNIAGLVVSLKFLISINKSKYNSYLRQLSVTKISATSNQRPRTSRHFAA